MKNIKFTLTIYFGGIFALWLLATSFPDQWGVFPVRNLLLQLTGTISILAMSACLILAVRPKILETPLGGLDKMYRLHKWLGIIAFSGSILHWTCKQFPKWLIALGLIDGKKPPRPPMQEILTLKDWLATQRHFAEEVGEIAFLCCPRPAYRRPHQTYTLPLVCQTPHTYRPRLSRARMARHRTGKFCLLVATAGMAAHRRLTFRHRLLADCPIQTHRQPAKRHRILPKSKRQPTFPDPECPKMARTPRRTIPLFTRTRRKPPLYHRLRLAA